MYLLCTYPHLNKIFWLKPQDKYTPLPESALKNDARTGIGIVARRFSTGMSIVRYWYWHLIFPVPVLAVLHLGSVPVQAQSITRIGIQKWCPYWY